MIRIFSGVAVGFILAGSPATWAATAGRVVSYTPGASTHPSFSSYQNADRALGQARRDTGSVGELAYLTSPYNAPWSSSDLVWLGSGGQITLELDHYATPLTQATEIGIFTSVFVNRHADSQATLLFNGDQAGIIRISEDGHDWVTLNAGDAIDLNTPTAGYVFPSQPPIDGPANPADYNLSLFDTPFVGTLDRTSGDAFELSRASAYGNSAGGNWIDVSGLGLSKIGFIQIERPLDADQASPIRLDAIYLNADAVAAAVPEPATLALIVIGSGALLNRRRPSA